jgi:hypothetical protein
MQDHDKPGTRTTSSSCVQRPIPVRWPWFRNWWAGSAAAPSTKLGPAREPGRAPTPLTRSRLRAWQRPATAPVRSPGAGPGRAGTAR